MDPAQTEQIAGFMSAYTLKGQHTADRAFTRYSSDLCKMTENNEISTGPGRYALGVPNAYGNAVFAPNPTVRAQKWGASHDMTSTKTDVESDLRNLARPTTRSTCGQYAPEEGVRSLTAMPEGDFPMTFARLVDPPCTARGVGVNRWEWLGENPQDNVMIPFEHAVDSRHAAKDAIYGGLSKAIQPLEQSPLVTERQFMCGQTFVAAAVPVARPSQMIFSDAVPGASQKLATGAPPTARFTPRGAPATGAGHPDAPPSAAPREPFDRSYARTGVLEAPAPFTAYIAPH